MFGTIGATAHGRTIEELEGKLTEHLGDFDLTSIKAARRDSRRRKSSGIEQQPQTQDQAQKRKEDTVPEATES